MTSQPLCWLSCFPQVCFSLSEELAALGSAEEKDASVQVPRDHPFTMQTVGGQTMAVFSQSDTGQSLIQLRSPLFCRVMSSGSLVWWWRWLQGLSWKIDLIKCDAFNKRQGSVGLCFIKVEHIYLIRLETCMLGMENGIPFYSHTKIKWNKIKNCLIYMQLSPGWELRWLKHDITFGSP